MTPGMIRARYAVLLDKGLTEERIANLTPRQIDEYYFYPRDEKTGELLLPKAPRRAAEDAEERAPTLNGLLFELDCLVAKRAITREDYERMVVEAHRKYGPKGDESGGTDASVGQ